MLYDFFGGLIDQVLHESRLVLLSGEVASDDFIDGVLDTRFDVCEWSHVIILLNAAKVLSGFFCRRFVVLCLSHDAFNNYYYLFL